MRSIVFLSVMVFVLPLSAFASTIVRTGETVAVSADQSVAGDFYGLGGTVALSGEVTEDLLVLGGTVTMNGGVGADAAVVGGTVDMHGVIKDDLRIVGGTVTIAGEVTGNLVVVASDLKVLSTATVGGDILFFGARADIGGSVGGNILGTSEYLRVDAPVAGGLDVKTRNLVLGERAVVAKDILYTSAADLTRAQNAVVEGDVTRSDVAVVAQNSFKDALIPFLITLFGALVFFLLFKRFTVKVAESAETRQFRAVLIGFATLFLMPLAAMILLLSTLGSLLGILLMFVYLAFLILTYILMGGVAGSFLLSVMKRGSGAVTVLSIVLGVALVHLLMYVPMIGAILILPLFVLTLGIVVERLYQLVRVG